MSKRRVSEEIVDMVYIHLCDHERGKENCTNRGAIAELFGLTPRQLRAVTQEINTSPKYDKLVTTCGNIYICKTKEECQKSIINTYRTAFSLLKKARAMEKKLGLNGQIRLSEKTLLTDIVEVFTEC